MKKARIFLTAITVLAVVGGALAFKTSKAFANVYCLTSEGCAKTSYHTEIGGASTTQPCAGITTYYTEFECKTKQNGTVFFTDL